MRLTLESRICLSAAGLILTTALAFTAAAQTQVPFKGTFQGTDTPTPPTLLQSITGNATHLGQFSSTAVSGGSPGAVLSAHWIAADGSTLDTTYSGAFGGHVDVAPCQVAGALPEDGYARITQVHTITGGTGRFAGVQGSFTLTKYHDLVLRNGSNGTCGYYIGAITAPGLAQ
jgi:hypothetical protein